MKTKKILIITFSFLVLFFFGLLLGKYVQSKEMKKIVYVDFLTEEISVEETEHKYQFLPKELSDYICQMCSELEIDSDLAIAILMQENPQVNLDAKTAYVTLSTNISDDILKNAIEDAGYTVILLNKISN